MKKILRSINDLFKSKDTLLAESVIENSIASTYAVNGIHRPLYWTFKHYEVAHPDILTHFRFETSEYRVVVFCSVTLHKYVPLAVGSTTTRHPVDVYLMIPSRQARLIDSEGKKISVKSSERMEDLISKAIYKSILIEG